MISAIQSIMDNLCHKTRRQRALTAIEKVSPIKRTLCHVNLRTPGEGDKTTPVCLKRRKKATRNLLLDEIHDVSTNSNAFDTFAVTEDDEATETELLSLSDVQTPEKSGGSAQENKSQSERTSHEDLEKKRLMRNVCKLTSPDETIKVDQRHRTRRKERRISINLFKHSKSYGNATHTDDVCSTGKKQRQTNARQIQICALQRMFCF